MIPGDVDDSPLAGLRRRLEAKRPLLADGEADAAPGNGGGGGGPGLQLQQEQQEREARAQADAEHGGRDDGSGGAAHAAALSDLVTFGGCAAAAPFDPQLEAALFLAFARDARGAPAPSAARRAADAASRVPEEELGLFVPPHPRVNNGSLYKLEQRLSRATAIDPSALARRAATGAPLPEPRPLAAAPGGRWWFGANGLMLQEPCPLKPHKERPARRWDQNEAETATAFLAPAAHGGGAAEEGRSYRLDVEVGRLEFGVHPGMGPEQRLAAKLLATYRELKRRQAVRLGPFYARRLAALEDALLAARAALFEAQEEGCGDGGGGGGGGGGGAGSGGGAQQAAAEAAGASPARRQSAAAGGGRRDQDGEPASQQDRVLELARRCAQLERDVAEARQLREEEAALLARTVGAMRRTWGELLAVRSRQGCALTDVQMQLVEAREEDDTPLQPDGLTRAGLDVALLIAEAEPISGLPDWPCDFPPGPEPPPAGFRLRRVEGMCAAHAAAVAEARARLELLQGRVSADPEDPETRALEARLALLGPAPRRAPATAEAAEAARARAEAEVVAAQAARKATLLEPVLTLATTPLGDASGQLAAAGLRAPGQGLGERCRYYARLLINRKVVGRTQLAALRDDFTADFREVFSVRLLKWPEAIQLQLWEHGSLHDTHLASVYLPVPGAGGSPHIDPRPQAVSWASLEPAEPAPSDEAAARGAAAGAADGQELGAPVFPAGVVFVRSGWVPEGGFAAVGCGAFGGPLSGTGEQPRAAAELLATGADATATLTLVRPFAGSPPPQSLLLGHPPADALSGGAAGRGSSAGAWVTYDNPLSFDGAGPAGDWGLGSAQRQQLPVNSASGGGGGTNRARVASTLGRLRTNPLGSEGGAAWSAGGGGARGKLGGWDVEAAPSLMPPQPAMTRERALLRTVAAGGQASRVRAAEWLRSQVVDPNDPRNAELLELLRAREAAAGAAGQASSDLFRLGLLPDLLLAFDRLFDQRVAFLRRRWEAGAYREGDVADGGAPCLVAPLSASDVRDQQDAFLGALARLEAAALGLPPAQLPTTIAVDGAAGRAAAAVGGLLVAPGGGRQERAQRWAQGALARALEERQQRIRDFALRLRAAGSHGPGERGAGRRRLHTDDVVRDTALPEFKLDLSSLLALMQPARPLRPRRVVRKITAAVPRETALVVTVQRAADLPARLEGGGGGGGSPTRGAQWSPTRGAAANRLSRAGARATADHAPPGAGAAPSPPASPSRRQTGGAPPVGWEAGGPGWEDVEGEPVGAGPGLSCFVEVKFRGAARRTVTIAFPVFDLHQEASPMALKESEGVLTVNVFDEVLTAASQQRLERARAASAARRGTRATRGDGDDDDDGGGGGGGGGISGNAAAWEALTEGGKLPERERRFLGCLRVPLAAIYQAEAIEGTFKLEVPPVILGYHQPTGRAPTLTLFITLRPRLAAPAPPDEERVSGEQDDVAQHAHRWVPALQALPQCRGRVVRAMAVDPDGLGTLLPRFVAPMQLPPQFEAAGAAPPAEPEDLGRLMLSLARWVAAVPFIEDAAFRRRRVDVWCGNAEALELGGCDHEEHAHMLAGLFLEVGQQAYVVLGTSLQGAAAAFVLTTGEAVGAAAAAAAAAEAGTAATAAAAQHGGDGAPAPAAGHSEAAADPAEQQQQQPQPAAAAAGAEQAAGGAASAPPHDARKLRLWNPLTGGCVPVRDPACEMREVGTVYDSANVWANVQPSGHPWDMRWNLADGAAWRPLFGAVLPPRELASMQVPPSYVDLDRLVYEELEARLEETVRAALYEARSVVITQPNNRLSRVLKALLRELPAQLAAIDAAALEASGAMAEGAGLPEGAGGGEAADYAAAKLRERTRLLRSLQAAHNGRVSREMRGCAINGQVLALPFSDNWAAAAAEAVLNTGLHRTTDPRVKFAMAAFVEPMGAAWVCRMWVYAAAVRDAA
ncbi:hypothetical protein Rsub_06131 [Raphidocelis subcapitata]|uniref:Uncharacterized protein n=1 Tax=Raphidocelis subcapitata TaxID=307507 RepID=A0A2V0P2I9_9CHLO|nr:hypothetical protein Rsub_06131 [Raphidocelis subcapitata]|eukprot:GBF93799.1 hypothetical protein Rsub_06131 [Raphidocelis subcapitata]